MKNLLGSIALLLIAGCMGGDDIHGLVLNGQDNPVEGVSVIVDGNIQVNPSNSQGEFEISATLLDGKPRPVITLSREGYLDSHFPVSDSGSLRIGMIATQNLANQILQDERLRTVHAMVMELLASNQVTAGGMYPEIWIRDLNTFVAAFLDSGSPDLQKSTIRETLLNFYRGQDQPYYGDDGLPELDQGSIADQYYGETFKKISVETDQETSLIQATCRYINKTGELSFFEETVNGLTVEKRIERAFEFLLRDRFDPKTGLIFGAVTVDWGDISPDVNNGIGANLRKGKSHIAIDVYDNAMLLLALDQYLGIQNTRGKEVSRWNELRDTLEDRIMKYLWDPDRMKFRAHIYPESDLGYLMGSPWPELKPDPFLDGDPFDEDKIYFHGGTGIAMLAGLLDNSQVAWSLYFMRRNVQLSTAQSIGLTIYPPYPQNVWTSEYTRERIGAEPYYYQNGGDWSWFGARIVSGLVARGFIYEAYTELGPMVDRVIDHNGFYEWWHPNSQGAQPIGAGNFRGSAGVLYQAIEDLWQWAERNHGT